MTLARAFLSLPVLVAVASLGTAAVVATHHAPRSIEVAPAAPTGTFSVDAGHSVVVYKIKHLGATNHYGIFPSPSGSFTLDTDPAKTTAEVSVNVSRVNSGNKDRDEHLKRSDFFNAEKFATISFKSTSAKAGSGGKIELSGDLTMLGVTKPVTASVEVTGSGEGRTGPVTGIEATFTIKRSEFGMKYGIEGGALGDDVNLIVSLEGAAKK